MRKCILILLFLFICYEYSGGVVEKRKRLGFNELKSVVQVGQELEIFNYVTELSTFYKVNKIFKGRYIELIERGTFYKLYITKVTFEVETFKIIVNDKVFY